MALEIEGSIRQKMPVQQGQSARGPWAKQEFVLEFPDGSFTSQACFTAWGQDKVQELGKYAEGDKVKVSFNLKSREYNGRWYNDLQIWKLAPVSAGAPAAPAAAPAQAYAPAAVPQAAPASMAPQGPAAYGTQAPSAFGAPAAPAFDAPAPTLEDMPGDDPEDDLPF